MSVYSLSSSHLPPLRDHRTAGLEELCELTDLHDALRGPLRAPIDVRRSRRALTPRSAARRLELEDAFVAWLDLAAASIETPVLPADPEALARTVTTTLRRMAARHRTPDIYRWVAQSADAGAVTAFLRLEGGPDHGFDDLVASCQQTLSTGPKVELARNYWDEMGNGDEGATHTELYAVLVDELGPGTPVAETPAAVRRDLLMSLLATRHDLQPCMLGALGMVELQAGPRCELVLQGLRRTGVAPAGRRFYEVHAEVDPTHGRDWLEKAIVPTVLEHPWMAGDVIRGAAWRCAVDLDFFADLERSLLLGTVA